SSPTMTEDSGPAASDEVWPGPEAFHDADDNINEAWLQRLRTAIAEGEGATVAALTEPLHAADIGDVIEVLVPEDRVRFIKLLGDRFDYSALTEVDEAVRAELMEQLPNAEIARGVAALDSDDAVALLEDIDAPDRDEILAHLPAFERLSLRRSLDFPEESAG